MPDDASPQPVLCEIAELRQWETEARHLTDSATAFAFEWARQNGGVPTTQEAVRRFYADWRARFPQYATADDEQVMARYRAWAEEKGISTPTESDFERFCSGPDLPEHPLLDAFGRLAHRMAARLGELARAAGSFGCDGATIAALQSAGDMLENVADNRLLLSEPANWAEAHHQVHRIFQDAAIQGIPLDDAWHVALDRLEVAAKKKLEAEATALLSGAPSAAAGEAGQVETQHLDPEPVTLATQSETDIGVGPLFGEGDQVYALVSSLLGGTRLSGPPADSEDKVAVALFVPSRPQEDQSPEWYEITPKIAVDTIVSAVQLCLGLVKLSKSGFESEYDRQTFARAFWFLNKYWQSLRTGIGRILSKHSWPPKLNQPLQLLHGVGPDSLYAALGMATVDAVCRAVLGDARAPRLSLQLHERDCDAKESAEVAEKRDRLWIVQQTQQWKEDTARSVSALIPQATARLRRLSLLPNAYGEWVRGLQEELCHVEDRTRPRADLAEKSAMPGGGASSAVAGEGEQASEGAIPPASAPAQQAQVPTPPTSALRSFTQADLDNAIREYKAQRASRYGDLVEAVKAGKASAMRDARRLFGRNAIAKALGCKSKAMVSKSAAWKAIAAELQLSKTAATPRQRVGEGIAVEQAAEAQGDTVSQTVIRQETLRLINAKLPKNEAEATVHKLQIGDMSDDDARKLVELYDQQQKDSKAPKLSSR